MTTYIEISGPDLKRRLKNKTKTYWLVEEGVERQILECYYSPGEYVIGGAWFNFGIEKREKIRVLVKS